MTNATFANKKTLFNSKLEETSKVPHLEHSYIWWWNLDSSESRSETSV